MYEAFHMCNFAESSPLPYVIDKVTKFKELTKLFRAPGSKWCGRVISRLLLTPAGSTSHRMDLQMDAPLTCTGPAPPVHMYQDVHMCTHTHLPMYTSTFELPMSDPYPMRLCFLSPHSHSQPPPQVFAGSLYVFPDSAPFSGPQ